MSHSNDHAEHNGANAVALAPSRTGLATPDRLASAIIASCREAIMSITMDGLIVTWNAAAERLTGYTAREMIGKSWQTLSHREDTAQLSEAVRRFERDASTFRVEARLVRKDGLVVQILVSISAILDGAATVIGLSGILRDITEDKQAAEKLSQSEERFKTVFAHSTDAISVASLTDGKYLEVNDEFVRMVGLPREQIIGKDPLELKLLTAEELSTLGTALLGSGTVRNREVRLTRSDGTTSVSLVSAVIVQVGAEQCSLGISKDITDLKRAEDHLLDIERQLSEVLANAPVAMLAIDLKRRITVARGRAVNAAGYTDTLLGKSITDVFLPHNQILQHMFRALKGETFMAIDSIIDGLMSFEVWYSPVSDSEHRVAGAIAIGTDITARMKAEDELRRSEEYYRSLVENSSDVTVVSNQEGVIIFAAGQGSKDFGYDASEFVGHQTLDFIHPDKHREQIGRITQSFAKADVVGRGEAPIRCKDGSWIDCEPQQLPQIEHLVVDEFQDLNACDQEFVRLLSTNGAELFVAGDDDQSIYSFRHADPTGIVQFNIRYPLSATHILSDCFRCTPAILTPASAMISLNPGRLPKNLNSLYAASAPPVNGTLQVWSFATAPDEAKAIASSCKELINSGMAGREDEILILVADRNVQLQQIAQELGNLGLQYATPAGEALKDIVTIRAVYSILRILRDCTGGTPDYVAHRSTLALMDGVGPNTARAVGDLCVTNNQNFHDLFYLVSPPQWLTGRPATAVARATNLVSGLMGWTLADTLANRASDIEQLMLNDLFTNAAGRANHVAVWNSVAGTLPQGMTLEELLDFLSANTDAEQSAIIEAVNQRLGTSSTANTGVATKKIRILTMHGAKGLTGKVVFIPSAEQGIMPNFRAIHATGLLNEHRRLFYVSLTRAMAACIVSHAAQHTGAVAFRLAQQATVNLPRSQFLNEMNVASVNRTTGLSQAEATAILADIANP